MAALRLLNDVASEGIGRCVTSSSGRVAAVRPEPEAIPDQDDFSRPPFTSLASFLCSFRPTTS
jgi:hypothetical protein